MQEIVDHEKNDDTLKEKDAYYSTKAGPKPKRTTDGVYWWNGRTDLARGFR